MASFKIDEYGRIEYKFWTKFGPREGGKGLFREDNKQKTDPLAALMEGLRGNVVGVVKDGGADGLPSE